MVCIYWAHIVLGSLFRTPHESTSIITRTAVWSRCIATLFILQVRKLRCKELKDLPRVKSESQARMRPVNSDGRYQSYKDMEQVDIFTLWHDLHYNSLILRLLPLSGRSEVKESNMIKCLTQDKCLYICYWFCSIVPCIYLSWHFSGCCSFTLLLGYEVFTYLCTDLLL